MRKLLFSLAGTLALPFSLDAAASDYLGAEALLAKAAEVAAADRSATAGQGKDSLEKLRRNFEAFRTTPGSDPTNSAKEWLSLVNRASKFERNYNSQVLLRLTPL